jgi:hypothetical protein
MDGVFALGKRSRVHADVSLGNASVGVAAVWDFIYKPVDGDSLKWYMGIGPSVVIYDDVNLGASAEVGLEYRFTELPIALGLDYRPALEIDGNPELLGGFGINARYVF